MLGLSPDDVRSHLRFKKKFDLPMTLLADTDHVASEAFGVWEQKSMFGKKYFGVSRTTFLISPDGTLARIFRKVEPEGHGEEVARALEELQELQGLREEGLRD